MPSAKQYKVKEYYNKYYENAGGKNSPAGIKSGSCQFSSTHSVDEVKEIVLAYLKTRTYITADLCFNELGILYVESIIELLRLDGHVVHHKYSTDENGLPEKRFLLDKSVHQVTLFEQIREAEIG